MAKINGLRIKDLLTQTFAVLALSATLAGAVYAAVPVPAETPCDPQYFESLKSRAWLEANREITQNQNLIFKPDSVLEYTCFDYELNRVALEAENMFSQTTRWGNIDAGDMAGALDNLVRDAVENYLNANFESTTDAGTNLYALGGRSPDWYPVNDEVTAAAPPACKVMQRVWQTAKCMNFMALPDQDGFYTFEEYRDGPEARQLPTPCEKSAFWDANILKATVDTDTTWVEDTFVTYLNRLDPANCTTTDGPNATFPIPTGIIVQRSKKEPATYAEKVCIAAGCHYVPTGDGDTGNCERP